MTVPLPEVGGLTWRPLTVGDVDAWWELTDRAQRVDRPGHAQTRGAVEHEARLPFTDLALDTIGGFDAEATLRAIGRVTSPPGFLDAVRVFLFGVVDPGWRGRGIGRAVLAWELARAAELAGTRNDERRAAGDPPLPAEAGMFGWEHRDDLRDLCAAAGLTDSRYFSQMRRDLAVHPPQEVRLPEGLTETTLEGERAFDLSLRAMNDAFRDHWGFRPDTPETWAMEVDDPDVSRRDLGVLVLDRDEPVAYAVTSVLPHPDGERSGHTELLGTVRAWRGRGLASYLLERSAALFVADGLPAATLGVDAASPTGAGRLYAAHGYARVGGSTYRARPLG